MNEHPDSAISTKQHRMSVSDGGGWVYITPDPAVPILDRIDLVLLIAPYV